MYESCERRTLNNVISRGNNEIAHTKKPSKRVGNHLSFGVGRAVRRSPFTNLFITTFYLHTY